MNERVRDRRNRLPVALAGNDNQKFVAAKPSHEILRGKHAPDSAGRFPNDRIAKTMSERIIHSLQVIKVDKQYTSGRCAASRLFHFLADPFIHVRSGRQAGEFICKGDLANLFGLPT